MTDSDTGHLADSSAPATPEDLFQRLQELGIETDTVSHPAVFTVEEAKALRGELTGCHTKNLFLRDKKGAMWLVVCREDRTVDLKMLAQLLGSGRLSFGSPERLMKHLGVIPGAVTPFAVMNDRDGQVTVALDRGMLDQGPWNFHPLANDMTTSIGASDMLRFLEAVNHPPQLLDFE
jgi:Ala-tRNA(Pro) deacylase